MQSNNPVFRRSEEFNSTGSTRQGYGQTGYTDPSTWGTGEPGQPGVQTPVATTGPMTIDSVVQKTALSLGVVVITAAITWVMSPDVDQNTASSALGGLIAAATIGSLAAFGLSLVNSFKRVISPALVMAFAVAEGIALGGLSKLFDAQFEGGIVTQAVIGTFAAFAGTLAAYKFFNIQVGNKFRTFVIAAVFGMVGLSLLEVVLGLFNSQLGVFGFGGVGLLFSIVGLVLGVFMLILDFDFVEQGVANGLPESESWRAAFGLTVSLVWIYTNLLRILAIFSDN